MRGFYYLYVTVKTIKNIKEVIDEIKETNIEVEKVKGDVVDLKDYK